MKVVIKEFWDGHRGIFFIVKRWRENYKKFNEIFSRVEKEPEICVIDEKLYKKLYPREN